MELQCPYGTDKALGFGSIKTVFSNPFYQLTLTLAPYESFSCSTSLSTLDTVFLKKSFWWVYSGFLLWFEVAFFDAQGC